MDPIRRGHVAAICKPLTQCGFACAAPVRHVAQREDLGKVATGRVMAYGRSLTRASVSVVGRNVLGHASK